MSVNFFETTCQEPPRTEKEFGLCDDQNGTKAYSDLNDISKWIATVINGNNISVTFTAVDNCVIAFKANGKDKESLCDGMLTFNDTLYFVELKDQKSGWIPRAICQLTSTIEIFIINHSDKTYRYKKVFACNKRHPYFQVIDSEMNREYYKTYGFRIDVQAEIIIK
jgi:hypothetical protein